MNKKFFGFLLVVAALFSVSTLESCKDTNADLTHEQMIQGSEQYQALSKRISDLETDLTNNYQPDMASVKEGLAAAKEQLKSASTKADLNALEATLDALVKELRERIDNLAKQARSLNVKGVYTNFGTFNTPFGINNGLIVAYIPSFYGGEICGKEIPEELFDDDVFAGTIYLTVNPVSTDFEGLSVDLVTTAGNAVPGFSLSPLVKSNEEIQFGIGTRANQYLYETKVLATVDDVERFSLDKEGAIETVKRVIDNKSINFRELGNVAIETLLNTKLDAYLVSLNQGDSVTLASDELLAAVAVEPLNFTHMDALGTVLEKVKALAEAKIEAFKAQINDFNIDIDIPSGQTFDKDFNIKFNQDFVVPGKVDVDIDFDAQDVNVNITDTTISVGIDTTYHISIEIPSVEIEGLDKINEFKSIVESMIDKATAGLDKLERLTIIANPVMFVMDEAGNFRALSTNPNKPTEVNSAEVVLYPTSYCLETVVPYFAKYVRVGNEDVILSGEKASVATELGQGVVEIEYAAIDYAGNQSVARKYYVKVVE